MNTTVNIGKGIELDIDTAALPEAALAHVIKIGLRNILMDSHAGINQKAKPELSDQDVVDQSKGVALKKLDALMRGEVRTVGTREPKVSTDPVADEMMAIAQERVRAALKARGSKLGDFKDKIKPLAVAYANKHRQALESLAVSRIAEREALSVDLDGLDI